MHISAVRSEECLLMLEGLNEFAMALVDIRNSSVTVVTRLLAAQQTFHGSIPGIGFLFSKFPCRLWNPSGLVFDDYRWLYLLEQNGRWVWSLSLVVIAEDKNAWSYVCVSSTFLHGMHRDKVVASKGWQYQIFYLCILIRFVLPLTFITLFAFFTLIMFLKRSSVAFFRVIWWTASLPYPFLFSPPST
jgi:hypothetical protein